MTSTARPTLATIAAALGVSRMTVSNAFNRPDQLSPELRAKVLAKAQELGYGGPDPVARTLSRGRTGSIGVIIDAPLTLAFTDPAAVQVLHGIATVCEEVELGMSLVPRIQGKDAELVKTALVDGFVVYCMSDDDPRLDAILERRLPYVLIDHAPDTADLTVNIDDYGAARATAEHLVNLGHRHFGVVLGWDNPHPTADGALAAMDYHVDRERLRGWLDGFASAHVAPDTVAQASTPGFNRESGRLAGGKLLDRANRPTAIVCTSDVLALGVLDAAAERGVPVPQQLSVTGFDDTDEGRRENLTTVHQPHQEKGAAALRLLLDKATTKASVLLPTEFVPRSSTAPTPEHMLSTGNPHMDAQRAFDRAARARRRTALVARARRRCVECLTLAVHDTRHAHRHTAASGVREIPLEQINATVEPSRALQFDAAFRPAAKKTRGRWERLWIAEQCGEIIPPISVVKTRAGYAVVDGHHRVSVARARGAVTIDALVSAA